MFFEVSLFVLSLLVWAYWSVTSKWNHWDKMGVFSPQPSFPFGNNVVFSWEVVRGKNIAQAGLDQHVRFGRPKFWGSYIFGDPVLTINDPEMIKQVMVRDFEYFVDRNSPPQIKKMGGPHSSLTDRIWTRQLISLFGNEWKEVRSTFTPIFTSGKMKAMVPLIETVAQRLAKAFEKEVEVGESFELKEKFGKFSIDAIASCAFGVDSNAFDTEESPFVNNARSIFRNAPGDIFKFVLVFGIPGGRQLYDKLGISVMKDKPTMFFYNILKEVTEQRREGKVRRNDLIDMMLDAMKDEENSSDVPREERLEKLAKKKSIDDLTLFATALVMFVAGYDTTAQTLSFVGYELAMNPDIQEKLQEEIDATLQDNNGKFPDYNTLQSLPYLEKVILETLRLHPAVGIVTRSCTKEYTFEGTNVKISPDDYVHINAMAVHRDPAHYPDPEKYDPERFSQENKANRHPYAFLAFGHGPRNCMGMRFALLELKYALFLILAKYNIHKTDKTPEKLTLDPIAQLAAPKEGLFVKVTKREGCALTE